MDTLRMPLLQSLVPSSGSWLVTGAAGFIGSNLVEALLKLDQRVVGLDNFSTGHRRNLDEVRGLVTAKQWAGFSLLEADIRDLAACREAVKGADFVLHQAALGSVPRSIDDPILTNANNIDGFLNMLVAARDAKVKSFVYAASSSTYGDHPDLPKIEDRIGRPLSPYAVTKYVNELYADVFGRCYGINCIGLRYFNIFGPRQDPDGAYAAVIPRWFAAMLKKQRPTINGDGLTSRDFCYVENAVQANVLSALCQNPEARGQVFNVAFGERTSLNELFLLIRDLVAKARPEAAGLEPVHAEQRRGDVRHSLADIGKARGILGYAPLFSVRDGLAKAADWYVKSLS